LTYSVLGSYSAWLRAARHFFAPQAERLLCGTVGEAEYHRFLVCLMAICVLLGGSVFALGYLLIAGITLNELWLKREIPT
jgi:hypothetical protein